MPTDIESYKIKYEGGVGKSPNKYTPFKMKGHELPGIKQRSPNTMKTFGVNDSENPEDVATSPGKAVGSPMKIGLFNIGKDLIAKHKARKAAKAAAAAQPAEATGGGDDGSHTHGAGGEVVPGAGAVEGGVGMAGGLDPNERDPITGQTRAQKEAAQIAPAVGIGNPMSDIRAKEKIERTGKSPSGIPIYEFNYIGGSNRYSGAMAQDLLEMNIDAVSLGDDGYYSKL